MTTENILIANPGEIACRVIKTAREVGIMTGAVYADADKDVLHVSMAEQSVHIIPKNQESKLATLSGLSC